MGPDPIHTYVTVKPVGPQAFASSVRSFCSDFDYTIMALMFMRMRHRERKKETYISLTANVLRQSRNREQQLYNSQATDLANFMVTVLTFCKIYGKGKSNNLYNVGSVVRLLAMMLLGQQLNDGLGQLHLLVLLLSQSCPHNGEDQHP